MSFFSDNPVLEREIRGRLRFRRKGAPPHFVWLGAALGLVIFYFYARGLALLWHGKQQDAQDLWPLLLNGLLALIVLLAPALSSTAITTEREQQTWDTLATTRLSAMDVLLGKWIARQTVPWLLIVLAFPYLCGAAARGQISPLSLPAVLIFLIVTTGFYSVLGLFCSFQARRTAAATATALTLTALLCVGTVIVNGVLDNFGPHGNGAAVMWLNPFYALDALVRSLNPDGRYGGGYSDGTEPFGTVVGCYLLLTLLLTCAALYFMVSRYRHAVRERS